MSQHAQADGSGNVFVQIAGNGNSVLLSDQPYLRLTRYMQRRGVRQEDGKASEADLVTAYTRSVQLVGRQVEVGNLWTWLENGDPTSMRVLIGIAARGKTLWGAGQSQGRKPGKGGDLAAVETSQFRHLGDQGARRGQPHAGHRGQQALAHPPNRGFADVTIEVPVQASSSSLRAASKRLMLFAGGGR